MCSLKWPEKDTKTKSSLRVCMVPESSYILHLYWKVFAVNEGCVHICVRKLKETCECVQSRLCVLTHHPCSKGRALAACFYFDLATGNALYHTHTHTHTHTRTHAYLEDATHNITMDLGSDTCSRCFLAFQNQEQPLFIFNLQNVFINLVNNSFLLFDEQFYLFRNHCCAPCQIRSKNLTKCKTIAKSGKEVHGFHISSGLVSLKKNRHLWHVSIKYPDKRVCKHILRAEQQVISGQFSIEALGGWRTSNALMNIADLWEKSQV